MTRSNRYINAGFTFIELVIVVVLLSVIGIYVTSRFVSTADVTLPSQALKMASDIRHAQLLATTSSRVLCLRTNGTGGNSYSVTEGLACPASPVITDPATGTSFSVTLQKGVVFGSGAAASLIFDSLGRPVNGSGVLRHVERSWLGLLPVFKLLGEIMRKHSASLGVKQVGFTLIELIIVIVLVGIMAAVAIPKFTDASAQAYLAKQQATLGALKSAWTSYYATNKAAPTCAQVAAQMGDPVCTGSGPITCDGVTKKDGTGSASFGCTDAGILTSPVGITCDAVNGC